jgi:uncharacterized membrane protein YbhN (UPF0104 family)
MYWRVMQNRSDDDYGESDSEAVEPSWQWSDLLWFPVMLFLMLVVLPLIPFLALTLHLLSETYSWLRRAIRNTKSPKLFLVFGAILMAVALVLGLRYL